MKDLTPGMQLEGVVTNVTNFGAFVDIGVHQDGLVHISQLADRFVEDPREVVKAGQIVTVKVLEVDIPRQRIALTMKLHERPGGGRGDAAGAAPAGSGGRDSRGRSDARPSGRDVRPVPSPKRPEPEVVSPLAAALSKLNLRRN